MPALIWPIIAKYGPMVLLSGNLIVATANAKVLDANIAKRVAEEVAKHF